MYVLQTWTRDQQVKWMYTPEDVGAKRRTRSLSVHVVFNE